MERTTTALFRPLLLLVLGAMIGIGAATIMEGVAQARECIQWEIKTWY